MKTILCLLAAIPLLITGCDIIPIVQAPAPIAWSSINETNEVEYAPYLGSGTGVVTGQAFLSQRGGGVVKGAGGIVALDPATTVAKEWWEKEAIFWSSLPPDWQLTNNEKYDQAKVCATWAEMTPPSAGFTKGRHTVTADADGRFKFTGLPAGKYYVSTTVSWIVGDNSYQGGLIGSLIEVRDGQTTEIILNKHP